MTVLISDVSSYKAAVVARFLKRAYPELKLVGTDHRPAARRFHTRWVDAFESIPAGPDRPEAYAAGLAAAMQKHKVTRLIPVNSQEIRILMERREAFGAALDYVGDAALYGTLDDKERFAALLARLGLPHPRSHADICARLPLVLKPARGSSARGVRYIRTEKDRAAAIADLGRAPAGWVIQDFVEGEGVGFSGFFREGRPLAAFAHRRVAEYPVSGGSSVIRESYPYADIGALRNLIDRLLAGAPWSGFAMFELKRRGPEDFSFIECNPRIWGSIHQGLAEGVNFFEPLFGAPSRAPPATLRMRTELAPLSWVSLLGYAACGRFNIVADAMRAWPRARLDVHPLGDPCGFIALLLRGA